MTIEAVIFDFGGVFTSSPFTGLHQWHVDKGLDPVKGLRIVFGPYDQDTDHPWHRVERGEIALEAAAEQIKALAAESGMDLDLRRRGYRTALITNNIAEFSDGWRAMIPVDEIFEVVVDSSAIGIRKPNLRIYELTLEQLGVAPEVSVFLDDAAGNIDAARAAGMHAILVGDDHTIAFAELAELLATEP